MIEHKKLGEFVDQVARMCQPDRIHWCDGSEQEYQLMIRQMIQLASLLL